MSRLFLFIANLKKILQNFISHRIEADFHHKHFIELICHPYFSLNSNYILKQNSPTLREEIQ